MGLVATLTSEDELDSASEDENKVYSKISREELIESLKELLTHFELRTNELKDLKEKCWFIETTRINSIGPKSF